MSAPAARALRRCVCNARSNPAFVRPSAAFSQSRIARKPQAADSEIAVSSNPKIASLVDQISQLTLLETKELTQHLRERLGIPEMPMAASFGSFVNAGAPTAAPAAPAEEEEAAPAAQEKTLFNLKLEKFDAASKPKVIKEIKAMLGLSLVDSKKFVESVPKTMKEGVPKEEAEKIVETLKALGATAVME